MICEKILGKLQEFDSSGKEIEYVDIEWHEAFKKIHKKMTDHAREIGIRMDDSVLKRGLFQDDVIYQDNHLLIVVNTPPCEVIEISMAPGHEKMIPKVCYEIGNRHAPLFFGDEENTFVTIYNEPMMQMLVGIHGVKAEKKMRKLEFDRRISASIHNHHH
ncbi:MAG: urease accessory protein UreE [Lachnospiraceae bacterium]|nr:urease accessory protein UreE [Robinsoniella sp.]MDY3767326.1 urease accessory protein UreE [Lachnospiraceae bacterium]